jgi:hypothetical protein
VSKDDREKFSSWPDFSAKICELFVQVIAANRREANQGLRLKQH